MIIGVTGGIGSGKTTVCSILKSFGAKVISVDEIGWQVLKEKEREIIKLFGKEIICNGEINRRAIGRLVFADKNLKEKFEKIVNKPLINKLKKEIKKSSDYFLTVVDCALIYEWGIENLFDKIILVTADKSVRKIRLLKIGYTTKEIEDRMRWQINEINKKTKKPPEFIIENNGSIDELKQKVYEIWSKIK